MPSSSSQTYRRGGSDRVGGKNSLRDHASKRLREPRLEGVRQPVFKRVLHRQAWRRIRLEMFFLLSRLEHRAAIAELIFPSLLSNYTSQRVAASRI